MNGHMGCVVTQSMLTTSLAMYTTCLCASRYMNPDRPRPFRAPLSDYRFPLVPVMGAGLSIILAFSLDSQNWYRLLGWMGAGLLIYFLYGRKNARKLREKKASLPTTVQYYQGPDESGAVNNGVIADAYSDPSEGIHKDNINDS